MTKVKKSPSIVLQYNWKLSNFRKDVVFLSRKIKYQKNESFRVGIKYMPSYSSPQLLFITTNLNKVGLKATTVAFSKGSDVNKIVEMNRVTFERGDENEAIQLFTAPVKDYSKTLPTTCSFNFTIYLDGIIENYKVQQMDGLLTQQLWSSITNQNGTDFNLIAKNGKSFPVHQWVLAARSNVFEVLLGGATFDFKTSMWRILRPLRSLFTFINGYLLLAGDDDQRGNNLKVVGSNHSMDFMSDEIEQFIKFIYTGEFEAPITKELVQLAVLYQVNSLEKLLIAASKDISTDKIAAIAMHLKPETQAKLIDLEINKPDKEVDSCEINYEADVTIIKFSWLVNRWTETRQGTLDKNIATSEAFEYEGKQLFRAELELWDQLYCYGTKVFTVRFFSYDHQTINCSTEEVTCCIGKERRRMAVKHTIDSKLVQLFTIPETAMTDCSSSSFSSPFVIYFTVKLRSTIPNFINKLVDSNWSEQLWAAAINSKLTDVKFIVGGMTFGAHRSLLSARSPVFAAMFASGMKEAETGQVRIEDIDPVTFKCFLKFLYTGMIEPSSIDKDLFKVADKYQVETLAELCRPATEAVEMGHLIETFLAC